MKLYAAQRSRAIQQGGYDVLTVGWVTAWVCLGVRVHQQVSGSPDGARRIEQSGGDLARHLADAHLADTPLADRLTNTSTGSEKPAESAEIPGPVGD